MLDCMMSLSWHPAAQILAQLSRIVYYSSMQMLTRGQIYTCNLPISPSSGCMLSSIIRLAAASRKHLGPAIQGQQRLNGTNGHPKKSGNQLKAIVCM
ncbi:unnamed protein product [Gongylonema pulchrum]|uniref:Secreted protein n=1 Tax=Gongylonema pulchrum TaxID=637853 RepID=A0A183DCS6_9BILA|nr:unnamed protein product [Gongylonema pulchrum]